MKLGPRCRRSEVNIAIAATTANEICPISACKMSVKGESDPRAVPRRPSTTKIDPAIHPTCPSRGSLLALANQTSKPAIRTATSSAPKRCPDSREVAAGVVGADGTGEIGRSRLVKMVPAIRTSSTQKATRIRIGVARRLHRAWCGSQPLDGRQR